MIGRLQKKIVEFRDERDWRQFHSPKNLAASISIEAAELLEVFQWTSESDVVKIVASRHGEIEAELADVMIYCLLLAHDTGIDVETAILAKLRENSEKYPAEKVRGRSTKYTEL
jgi:NTP pyrophosphatase (non-canonical NTP hydrolase)